MLKHKIFRTEQLIEWADPVVHLLLLLKWCMTMTYPRIKTVNIAQNNGVFKLPSKVTAGKDAKTNVFNSFNENQLQYVLLKLNLDFKQKRCHSERKCIASLSCIVGQ